jgi:hypothetical protein
VLLTPEGAEAHLKETRQILAPLLINREIKEEFEKSLKIFHLDCFGLGGTPLPINSDKDMVVIDKYSPCRPRDLHSCTAKIKAIAISTAHRDFTWFVQELQYYENLQIVFIMLSNKHMRKFEKVRDWDDANETRISHSEEAMFESIHPNNPYINMTIVPDHGDVRNDCTLHNLHKGMARREGGMLVTPHIRYVRLILKGRLEREDWMGC